MLVDNPHERIDSNELKQHLIKTKTTSETNEPDYGNENKFSKATTRIHKELSLGEKTELITKELRSISFRPCFQDATPSFVKRRIFISTYHGVMI